MGKIFVCDPLEWILMDGWGKFDYGPDFLLLFSSFNRDWTWPEPETLTTRQ